MTRKSNRRIAVAALTLAASGVARTVLAQHTVTGTVDTNFYTLPPTLQTINTGFGDSTGWNNGNNGSELDAAYTQVANGTLYLMITGNLESNGNHFNLFISDGRAGGQSTLNYTNTGDQLHAMNGSQFSPGFNATYALDGNIAGGQFFLDQYNLITNTKTFLGSLNLNGATPGINSSQSFGGIAAAFNDTNSIGVLGTSGTDASLNSAPNRPQDATTGLELAIPLAALGSPAVGTQIKILTDINGSGNGFLSNQFLAGLPVGSGNVGGNTSPFHVNGNSGAFNFSATSGAYFSVTVPLADGTWLLPGSGSWSNASAWSSGHIPNASGALASFGTATANASVTLDGTRTVGTLQLNATGSYNISQGSGGTLTMNNGASAANIQVFGGSHLISAPIALNSNTTVSTNSGGQIITLAGNITGAGGLTTFTPSNAINSAVLLTGTNSYSNGTTINGGNLRLGSANALPANSNLTFNASDLPNPALDLNGNNISLSSVSVITGPQTTVVGALAKFTNTSATPGTATITYNGPGSSSFYGNITDSSATGGGSTALTVFGGTLNITTGTSNYGGANTINAGTLGVASGATLNVSNVVVSDTLNVDGNVSVALGSTLSGGGTVNINSTGTVRAPLSGTLDVNNNGLLQLLGGSPNVSHSGAITGGGTLAMAGSNGLTTQILGGGNGYSGPSIASNGVLVFTNTGAWGFTAYVEADAGGAVGLGTGTLATSDLEVELLNAPNNNVGGLALASSESGAAVNFTTFPLNDPKLSGMSVGAQTSMNYTGTITPNPAVGYRIGGTGAATMTISSALTGGNNVSIVNGGTIVLNNAGNNYTGNTIIGDGSTSTTILSIASPNVLGNAANGIVLNSGGVLAPTVAMNITRSISTIGAGSVQTPGATVTLSGPISGNGGLTKLGGGTLLINAAGTYSGTTSFGTGTIQAGGTNFLSPNSQYNTTGGTVDLNGFAQSIGSLAGTGTVLMSNNLTVGNDNSSTAFSGTATGGGSLTKIGNGALSLSGTGLGYTGGTQVNSGWVSFANGSLPASGNITALAGGYAGSSDPNFQTNFVNRFNKAGTNGVVGVETTVNGVDLTGFGSGTRLGSRFAGTINGTVTPATPGQYQFGGGGGDLTVNAPLTGSASVDINHSGVLPGGIVRLVATNTYSGTTSIAFTRLIAGPNNLGDGSVTNNLIFNTGTLQLTGSVNTSRTVTLNGGQGELDTGGFNATFSGNFSGTGGMAKSGGGTLLVTGTHTYTGATTINGNFGGTLAAGATNVFSPFSTFDVQGNATLDTQNFDQTIGALQGFGIVNTNANLTLGGNNASTAFNGAIVGTGNLIKVGGGTQSLVGVSSFTGTTTVNAGTLLAVTPFAIPGYLNAGNVTTNSGGTTAVSPAAGAGQGQWASGDIDALLAAATFNNGSSLGINVDDVNGTFNYGSNIALSNTVGLTKSGPGSLELSGNNVIKGTLLHQAGALAISGTTTVRNVMQTGGTLAVTGTGVLHIAANNRSAVSTSVLSAVPSIDATAKIDVEDNAAIIKYDASDTTHSARQAIRNLLKNGRNAGPASAAPWNGAGGIVSTFAHTNGNGFNLAIGYADNTDLAAVRASGSYTVFGGQTVASNTVLVQLTRGADATLDGAVDGQDVAIIGTHFQKPGSGQWCFGDFDYSGTCDGSDVSVLGTTFGKTSPLLSPAQMTAEFGAAFTAAFEAGQAGAVPEPTSLSLIGLGAVALIGNRRRRAAKRLSNAG